MARIYGKKGRWRLCEAVHLVGGEVEGPCRQAEEDLTEHSPSADMRLLKVDSRDVHHLKKWRAIRWCTANPAADGTPP